MVGVLQIIKLLPMPLIITLQLSLIWLVEKLMQVTVLLNPLIIKRITLLFPWTMYSETHFPVLSTTLPPLGKLRI